MTVEFPTYGGRRTVAALLETPARVLIGTADSPTKLDALADMRDIIAELDAMDAAADAEGRNRARVAGLTEQVRARLVTPAPADARCSKTVRKYVRAVAGVQVVTHAAKVLVNGVPFCLTHAKIKAERAVRDGVGEAEAERRTRGELTEDERIIEARGAVVWARRR